MNERIRGFDGLRALAVLLVFIHHKAMAADSGLGHLGVWIFFALSGFLIADILTKQRGRIDAGASSFIAELKRFLFRRTLRIFPVYYLLLVTLTLLMTVGLAGPELAGGMPFHFAYLSNFWIADVLQYWPGRYSHLWSLSVEEQFYLFFAPLLLAIGAKWHSRICGAIFVAGVATLLWMKATQTPGIVIYTHPLANFWLFALGGIGGAWVRRNGTLGRCLGSLPVALALAGGIALMCGVEPAWERMTDPLRFTALYVTYGACIAALVCAVACSRSAMLLACLEWKPLAALGKISYGFYLYHGFMPDFTRNARVAAMFGPSGMPAWAHAASFAASFLLTLMLAGLSWRFIEEPVLRLKNRRPAQENRPPESRPGSLIR
ncbi:acyltransferase [Caballeronia sp. LZ032]|uniref:acyltransferase family protein n=1 Tax=Caballeronia sp. LZ032 TaxID=3038565 RepID=UPI0028618438|nr:acyltransferase [Caballeronia sp. LZ032]MDR5881990.1 acyltransferase [Caballeronia sp. LZ032]